MKKELPPHHHRVIPYLILSDPEQFFDFTKKAFDATELHRELRGGQLIHGEILIGDSCIMFGKSSDNWGNMPAGLFIYVEDADLTLQKALNAGASIVSEISNQSYGRTAGIKDPQGNTWWITAP